MDTSVRNIERIWVEIPFRKTPGKHIIRENPSWNLFEICKVHLACGVVGIGETTPYYTHQRPTDETVARAMGKEAAEIMWDDTLGAGLQMALFDAVGKVLEVPVHQLFGQKKRDRALISWWAIDMPAEDWLTECKQAIQAGYTNFKTKARPWYDLNEQLSLLSRELPEWFEIDMDFNGFLLNTSYATRVLTAMEKYPQVCIYETPIPQNDALGNKHLRAATTVPIALHYGNPPIMTTLKEDLCDGFVISGGASSVIEKGTVAAAAEKVFFLQHVGTTLTATWGLHLAAVLSHARWPAINCHHMHTHQIVGPTIQMLNGHAAIPEAPGIGVELDEDVVERFRIDPKPNPYPLPGQLFAIRWPSGASTYYSHCQQYWHDFLKGQYPVFSAGVHLDHIADNGSNEWSELQERAQHGAVHMSQPII